MSKDHTEEIRTLCMRMEMLEQELQGIKSGLASDYIFVVFPCPTCGHNVVGLVPKNQERPGPVTCAGCGKTYRRAETFREVDEANE